MVSLSIITVTYNAATTITDSLQSVSNQTYLPIEHIIIDGASTDSTLDVIKNFRFGIQGRQHPTPFTLPSSPLTHIISEPDSGIYDAMNKGIALATGDIIGILNSDDFYYDNRVLERVAEVFEDPIIDACYGDLVYVKEIVGTAERFKVVRYWKSGTYSQRSFYWGWMPPHPTFFVRKSVYEKYGLFRLDLGSAADYELMLRFLLKHSIKTVYIPDILVSMRIGGASNLSVTVRLKANKMDKKAWEVNKLKPYPWTLLCKPVRKITQFLNKNGFSF